MAASIIAAIISAVAGIGSIVYSSVRDKRLTGAENEANQFNAAQAEVARDWQQSFYEQYQSPKALMDQYSQAGLNPALMYSGSAVQSPISASPAASSVTPNSRDTMSGLVSSLASLSKLTAEIENIRADTNQKNSETDINAATRNKIIELTPVEKEHIASEVTRTNAQTNELNARCALDAVQAAFVTKQTDWIDKLSEVQVLEGMSRSNRNNFASKELEQRILNLKQDIVESYSRCLNLAAERGLISQETLESYERTGLYHQQTDLTATNVDIAGYERTLKKKEVAWYTANNIVRDVTSVLNSVGYATFGIGSLMKGFAPTFSETQTFERGGRTYQKSYSSHSNWYGR